MKKITLRQGVKYVETVWGILFGYVVLLWANTLAPHSKAEIFQRSIGIVGIICFTICFARQLYYDGYKKTCIIELVFASLVTFFINKCIVTPTIVAFFSLIVLFFPLICIISLFISYLRKKN